jgi:hypothetical protein
VEVTDRELLELAAKAAGYKKYYSEYLGRKSFVTYDDQYFSEVKECLVTGEKTLDWNPLTDDGDALRLAVKLNMRIGINSIPVGYTVVISDDPLRKDTHESIGGDPYAATRRAIVRAAAIGQSLPATSSASSS